MADDDLVAIISFLRAQPPVRNAVPESEWTTMGKPRMTTEDIGALYEYLHSLPPLDGPTGEPTFKKTD